MTSEHLRFSISQIDPLLEQARDHYYQLVLILGGAWQDRTIFLKEIARCKKYAYLALGLPLSRALLDLPLRDRPIILAEHVSTWLTSLTGDGVAFDHIEILFDPALRTDPLRLLQTHARSRVIVASWPGRYEDDRLTYAEPGYSDYYQQTIRGLLTYSLEVTG